MGTGDTNQAGVHPTVESQGVFHPVDSDDSRCPAAKLGWLRANQAVSLAEREGFPPVVLVTKSADVAEVYRNWRVFQSIGADPNVSRHDATPIDQRSIIALDPPVHTWARRLANIAMAPGPISVATPRIGEMAKVIADRLAEQPSADLVTDWAEPLPSDAIGEVLGLPADDRQVLHDWVTTQFSEHAIRARQAAIADGAGGYGQPAEASRFSEYLHDQFARRRAEDRPPDAITRMMEFRRDDGTGFTDTELVSQISTLITAGNETTTSLMSNLAYRLLATPGLYDRMRDDRTLVPAAIEESLRLDPPLQTIIRRATVDTEIGGVGVPAGAVIALSTTSGNHDEAVWGADSQEFDVERFHGEGPPPHLGFGIGIHHCVGAYLARTTTNVGINALLDRFTAMELPSDYEYDNVYFHIFHRPKALPVDLRTS